MTVDSMTNITESLKYFFYGKHRGRPTNEISVWTVGLQDELTCFKTSFDADWKHGDHCWGFIPSADQYVILGANLLNSQLCFAKFVGDRDNLWHGYPADFKNKPNDKPKNPVLMKWINGKFINKAVFRKIQQGQI